VAHGQPGLVLPHGVVGVVAQLVEVAWQAALAQVVAAHVATARYRVAATMFLVADILPTAAVPAAAARGHRAVLGPPSTATLSPVSWVKTVGQVRMPWQHSQRTLPHWGATPPERYRPTTIPGPSQPAPLLQPRFIKSSNLLRPQLPHKHPHTPLGYHRYPQQAWLAAQLVETALPLPAEPALGVQVLLVVVPSLASS